MGRWQGGTRFRNLQYLRLEEGGVEVRRGSSHGSQMQGGVGGVGDRDDLHVRGRQRSPPERQGARSHRHTLHRLHSHRFFAPFLTNISEHNRKQN